MWQKKNVSPAEKREWGNSDYIVNRIKLKRFSFGFEKDPPR